MPITNLDRRLIAGRFLSALMLTPICALLLAGCGQPPQESAPASGTSGSDVIATVNGVVIDRDQMYAEMEQCVPSQLSPAMLEESAGRVALQRLISDELTVQLAAQAMTPVTDQEVDSRYQDVKMVREAQSTRTFEDLLTDQGLTEDQFKAMSIKPDVARFNIYSKSISVSDEDLQNYYNSHVADYTVPDSVHLERIVLPDEATAQQAYQTASKAGSLDSVMGQNIEPPLPGGLNGADIAQWINIDTAPAGLQPLATLAATAAAGAVLKPVDIQNQWWLVKVVDRKAKVVLSFDQVKNILRWTVVSLKAHDAGVDQKITGEMQDMLQQAVITVKPPEYISLIAVMKNPSVSPDSAPTPSTPSN